MLGNEYQYLAVADLNGDGKSDIIAASFHGNVPGVSVFFNQGGATFASPKTYPANAADFIEGLAVADVDGDGVLDIVVITDDTYQVEAFYGSCL